MTPNAIAELPVANGAAPSVPSPPTSIEETGLHPDTLVPHARFTSTVGRVDWALSSFRGFQAFPSYSIVGRALSGPPA